jgi:hypothetical protein
MKPRIDGLSITEVDVGYASRVAKASAPKPEKIGGWDSLMAVISIANPEAQAKTFDLVCSRFDGTIYAPAVREKTRVAARSNSRVTVLIRPEASLWYTMACRIEYSNSERANLRSDSRKPEPWFLVDMPNQERS